MMRAPDQVCEVNALGGPDEGQPDGGQLAASQRQRPVLGLDQVPSSQVRATWEAKNYPKVVSTLSQSCLKFGPLVASNFSQSPKVPKSLTKYPPVK